MSINLDDLKHRLLNHEVENDVAIVKLTARELQKIIERLEQMDEGSFVFVDNDGNKFWKDKNGNFHREDGPAIEYANGTKFWYQHGKLHREDGPAVEHANGTKVWYLNGQEVSEAEVKALGKMK